MLYSPSTRGFYHPDRHGPQFEPEEVEEPYRTRVLKRKKTRVVTRQRLVRESVIPKDAIDIGAERHAELMAAQAQGKTIIPGPDGAPITVDPPLASAPAPYASARELFEMIYEDLKAKGVEGRFTAHIEAARAQVAPKNDHTGG